MKCMKALLLAVALVVATTTVTYAQSVQIIRLEGGTTNQNVGERVRFGIQAIGTTPLGYTWTVDGQSFGGNIIKDYEEHTNECWAVIPMQPDDYLQAEFEFYWLPEASQIDPLNGGPVAHTVACNVFTTNGSLSDVEIVNVERNETDPDRQPIDFYVNNHPASWPTGSKVLNEHGKWHQQHPYTGATYEGTLFFRFHKILLRRFDLFRTLFGYPKLVQWNPLDPYPTEIPHAGRNLEPNGPQTPTPTWFTTAGGGGTRPYNFLPCDVTFGGEESLGDFPCDLDLLGCAVTHPFHNQLHGDVNGDMASIYNSPRDPLFWRWHKYVDQIGNNLLGENQCIYPWIEYMKPFALYADRSTTFGNVYIRFFNLVVGVQPGALTVNGSPATSVSLTPDSLYEFTGFAMPGNGAVTVTLASSTIEDLSGNPFPGESWDFVIHDPLLDDDNDGLNNTDEIDIHGTDPNNPDTDGDCIKDGDEVSQSRNPLLPDRDIADLQLTNITGVSGQTQFEFTLNNTGNIPVCHFYVHVQDNLSAGVANQTATAPAGWSWQHCYNHDGSGRAVLRFEADDLSNAVDPAQSLAGFAITQNVSPSTWMESGGAMVPVNSIYVHYTSDAPHTLGTMTHPDCAAGEWGPYEANIAAWRPASGTAWGLSAVPTLSEWGIIALCALLAFIGIMVLRSRGLLAAAIAVVMVCLFATGVAAKETRRELKPVDLGARADVLPDENGRTSLDSGERNSLANRQGITILGNWTFDGPPGSCIDEGWTSFDRTADQGLFFHIDDFPYGGGSNGTLLPIDGAQSLWCGTVDHPDMPCVGHCLPGYLANWQQCWESVTFARTGSVDIGYDIHWDSEAGYDFTFFQYWDGVDWVTVKTYDGSGTATESFTIPGASLPAGEVKLRFYFTSDGAFDDGDCLWISDGAVIIDNLSVSDANGPIDFQDFEADAVGANITNDGNWSACTVAYGDFAGLFEMPDQEDPCRSKRCVWGFFNNSPVNYGCGGHGNQLAVPYQDDNGLYIDNEIRSPVIPWVGAGTKAVISLCVYEDLPLDALVFYDWRVRTSPDGICWEPWCGDEFVYYGDSKRWVDRNFDISDCIPAGTQFIQIALGAMDLCEQWCGVLGSGLCHSHAPLFDNITLYREELPADQRWDVTSQDLFQDSFPNDGTDTGPTRIDTARDLLPPANPNILPGDSALVRVTAAAGLDNDLNITGTANRPSVYAFVKEQPGRTGLDIEDPIYPLTGVVSGWARFLCNPTGKPDEFAFDVHDGLFTPPDVMEYLFGAVDLNGDWTYWSENTGTVSGFNTAAAQPVEITCLPGPGVANGGDILYVDDADGLGVQPFFDSVYQIFGIENQIDRYDVRDPEGAHGNGLGGRVQNVVQQLLPHYKIIIWSSGSLKTATVGDGTGMPDKGDDWSVLYTFLDQHPDGGGVYLSGDNIACEWMSQTGTSAGLFKSKYMNHNLLECCHTALGLPMNPLVIGNLPFTVFQDNGGVADQFYVFGGCPTLCCFDVLQETGASVLEMTYEGLTNRGAVLSQATPNAGFNISRVKLSGFSLHKIRQDAPVGSGIPDRAVHLGRVLNCMQTILPIPVGAGDGPLAFNTELGRAYPNPFNPNTTIPYVVGGKGAVHVSLSVYDVAGRLVATLVDKTQSPGAYTAAWDGAVDNGGLTATGVYFARLEVGEKVMTNKLVLVK